MNSSTPHVCNNAPRPEANHLIEVQDGYTTLSIGHLGNTKLRVARMVMVPFLMSVECQYDKDATDPRCKGCKHGLHVAKEECDHNWQPWPISAKEGTEWCNRCDAHQHTPKE